MSESVKMARTLVWHAGGGDAGKADPICDSTGRRNLTLFGGEKGLSLQRFTRVSRMNYYMQVLIPGATYTR